MVAHEAMRVREFDRTVDGGAAPVPELSVVVPTFNEAGNVRELLRRLVAETAHQRVEIIFVDDSTDDTAAVIAAAAPEFPVRIVLAERERAAGGLGGAVVEGLKLAAAPWAVVMDGDLQHPPALVPVLHRRGVDGDADLVVATRYETGGSREGLGSAYRLAVSRSLTALASLVLGPSVGRISDPLSGFFAVRLAALRLEEARPLGYKVLLELVVRFDLRKIVQVPYEFGHRFAEESKSTYREGLRYLRHVRQLRQLQLERRRSSPRPVAAGQARLSVLVVTSEAPPVVSGISRCVDRIAAGLRERGHRVDVVSSVQVPRFMVGEYRFSTMLLYWPRLALRFRHYDVVNLHGPVPTLSDVFLILWRIFSAGSRPVVYTHHSALQIRGAERICGLYNRLHRRLAKVASLTMVTSQYYADEQRIAGGPPARVVPWGVDMRAEPLRSDSPDGPDGAVDRPLRVLFVGQMRGYKGVDWLLSAVAAEPRLELRLVGDGAELPHYRRLATRIGAANAEFLGRVPDEELHAEYDRSDVIVLPSVTQAEAFGLVVVEGMAAGCVPVVSDLPGVRDVVADTGLVVPPGDHAALRDALAGLAADRERLAALRIVARSRAKELSWDTCVVRYEEAFRDAVAAGAATVARA